MAEWFSQSLAMLLFIGGAILLIAEAVVPGAHLFVLGVALLTTGIVGILLPTGLGILGPLILAALVLGVTGLTLWGYRELDIYGGGGLAQTSDSSSLRGQFGYVTERVSERSGEVKLDDGGFNPHYRARSVDGEIEVGSEVMVVDPGGGNVVTVEPVAGDEIDQELAAGRDASSARERDETVETLQESMAAESDGSRDETIEEGDENGDETAPGSEGDAAPGSDDESGSESDDESASGSDDVFESGSDDESGSESEDESTAESDDAMTADEES